MNRLSYGLLAAAFLTMGCGDESGSPNYEGEWSYTADNLTGANYTCSLPATPLTIENQGTAMNAEGVIFGEFDAVYEATTLSCAGPAGQETVDLEGNEFVGTFEGRTVELAFEPEWINNGTLSGDRMSGMVSLRATLGGNSVLMNGTFEATR